MTLLAERKRSSKETCAYFGATKPDLEERERHPDLQIQVSGPENEEAGSCSVINTHMRIEDGLIRFGHMQGK